MLFELSEQVYRPTESREAPGPGWARLWHGGFAPPELNTYSSGDLQRFAFLGVLQTYRGQHINFFELGAGYGHWSIALRMIAPSLNISYRVLAVEGEPTHYQWLAKCLEANDVANATAIHGAVDGQGGTCRFQNAYDPASRFGQRILEEKEPGGIEIRAYTLAELMASYNFSDVQLIHMDVQEREAKVIAGGIEVIECIEYILIETHTTKVEEQLKELLAPTHNLIVELPRFSRIHPPGFSRPIVGHGGGVHLWQQKGLG
uniref:Putative methyltransferase n=1 Tax=viral metagenome TaxID=1070528 RepID=A0A6M3ISS0_9ZZZZ